MKLHLAFLVILIILIVKFQNSEAQDTSLDSLYDQINKPKSDDNVINGNNNKDRVQVNGEEQVNEKAHDNTKDQVNEKAHDNKKDVVHKKNTTSNANVLNTAYWLNGCFLAQLLYFLMRKCL